MKRNTRTSIVLSYLVVCHAAACFAACAPEPAPRAGSKTEQLDCDIRAFEQVNEMVALAHEDFMVRILSARVEITKDALNVILLREGRYRENPVAIAKAKTLVQQLNESYQSFDNELLVQANELVLQATEMDPIVGYNKVGPSWQDLFLWSLAIESFFKRWEQIRLELDSRRLKKAGTSSPLSTAAEPESELESLVPRIATEAPGIILNELYPDMRAQYANWTQYDLFWGSGWDEDYAPQGLVAMEEALSAYCNEVVQAFIWLKQNYPTIYAQYDSDEYVHRQCESLLNAINHPLSSS